ncbi:hypothetical protein GCM10010964_39580 [Caldovatus sediminis]|uniref:DUF3445 domain-containing protein n=1 Tax=Caldovatus sediminis TaxID=2041189 RepID=A0A8J2ZF73_9PROT|nr:DUF3445 domain-containing protein [Caldovatus sediminis]GGG48318.1 hypothetical protein GCM10010964_39580 [Caldovatus sediminis]
MTLPPPRLHLPYAPGPFRMAMGLTAVPEAEWIEIDAGYPAQLALRRALLAERRTEVLAALPGSGAAARELLACLAANLAAHHPERFRLAGGRVENRLAGETWPLPRDATEAEEALATLGHLVQEDFCLLRPDAEGPRLIAAVLCFPSRWRLRDKLGAPLAAVHGPVPLYAERLARPVDRFLAALAPGRLALRFNWAVHDDPTLFQPGGGGDTLCAVTPRDAGDRLFLRVERQTFRLLPESRAVAFGIRTHVAPLAAVAAEPGEAARLAAAVRALPPEMRRYKGLHRFEPALLAWLDARAAG